jgi:hypothetical protein
MDYCPNNGLQYENIMHETRMKAQKLLTFGIKFVHGENKPISISKVAPFQH